MSKETFTLLETILQLNDKDKKKCLHYLERAHKELTTEIARLKGNTNETNNLPRPKMRQLCMGKKTTVSNI